MNIKSFIEELQSHAETLDASLLGEIGDLSDKLQSNLASAREEGRNLRIAIIGEMKAGKSSFINAAFFNRDLLPKADIPMTAALTKIVYATKVKAEAVLYSKDSWGEIEQLANRYDQIYAEEKRKLMEEQSSKSKGLLNKLIGPSEPSEEEIIRRIPLGVKASRELVENVRKQGLDVHQYLGKTNPIDNVDGVANLAKALHDYVGSKGRFTAITQMTILHVDDKRLEGIEIIDTPGFNDPLVSRGRRTRTFLGQCDVIFLLSNISQFVTESTMSVLREQLPEAGIDKKAVFLIGTQRDLALRQDRAIYQTANELANNAPSDQKDKRRVAAMMQVLDRRMNELATQTLDKQIDQPGMDEHTRSILSAVKQTKPRFISSWAWMTAERFDQLSADDRFHLDALEKATGYAFTPDDLRTLSNIESVRNELLAQRQHKAELLAGKENGLLTGARDGIARILQGMLTALNTRSKSIQSGNIEDLKKTESDMIKRINGGCAKLEDIFDQQIVEAQQKFASLKTDLRREALKYQKVEKVSESEQESYTVSTSRWYNPFSWGDSETRYRTVVTSYASAQDAIEQVENFTMEVTESLQKAIKACVDIDGLREKLSKAAMSLFDTGSADFDAESMLLEVNKSLRRITIPDIEFGSKDYSNEIVKAFGSGRVSESQIDKLRDVQIGVIRDILKDMEAEVDNKINAIVAKLESTGKTFVDDMVNDITESLTQLRDDIANKEESLERIEKTKALVAEKLSQLDAMFSLS